MQSVLSAEASAVLGTLAGSCGRLSPLSTTNSPAAPDSNAWRELEDLGLVAGAGLTSTGQQVLEVLAHPEVRLQAAFLNEQLPVLAHFYGRGAGPQFQMSQFSLLPDGRLNLYYPMEPGDVLAVIVRYLPDTPDAEVPQWRERHPLAASLVLLAVAELIRRRALQAALGESFGPLEVGITTAELVEVIQASRTVAPQGLLNLVGQGLGLDLKGLESQV